MTMKMKAQAAMEYLMTYGWAILIVIIVAAALYAFGIFNPATWTGTRVTGFANIGSPVDWTYYNNGTFYITVKNAIGSTITISSVTANCGTGTPPTVTLTNTTTGLTVGVGGTKEFTGTCATIASASSYSVPVSVSYTKGRGVYPQTDIGTVTGSVV